MTVLCNSVCEPCQVGAPLVTPTEQDEFLTELQGWQVNEIDGVNQLQKQYLFKNFKLALDFTNALAVVAEKEGHHPGILTEWGKVTVTWWTHKINGLHKNDFIMAARTDNVFNHEAEPALANI